jgi:FkbM family methyltransferase
MRLFDIFHSYPRVFGSRGVLLAFFAYVIKGNFSASVIPAGQQHRVFLRLNSSDIGVYEKVFFEQEYHFTLDRQPEWIIDAGANIGLASLFFAQCFPSAKVLAIEPEKSNFAQLCRNVAPYSNIIPMNVALWKEDIPLRIVDPGFGHWAFQTKAASLNSPVPRERLIQGLSVESLKKKMGMNRIDILKIDIEGAEKEVFENAGDWIDSVETIIAELHDRLKPGCSRSFFRATTGFAQEWTRGENIFVSRSPSQDTTGMPVRL